MSWGSSRAKKNTFEMKAKYLLFNMKCTTPEVIWQAKEKCGVWTSFSCTHVVLEIC